MTWLNAGLAAGYGCYGRYCTHSNLTVYTLLLLHLCNSLVLVDTLVQIPDRGVSFPSDSEKTSHSL